MRSVFRSGLWCLIGVGSALAVACGDDSDTGGSGNAGTSSAGEPTVGDGGQGGKTAGGAAAGGTTAGGMAGTSPSAGTAGRGGAGAAGGAGGDASRPSGGAAGSGGADAGGMDAGAGGTPEVGGAGGVAGEGEPGFAYVSTILGGLVALSVDGGGDLQKLDGSPVGSGHLSNVLIDHRKKFLYTLDADRHEISLYPLASNGKLPAEPVAKTDVAEQPLTAALDPSDEYLYVTSQSEGVVSTFAVGAADGKLTLQGAPLALDAPPGFVAVSPSGEYLYVSQQFPGGIRGFAIDAQDGSLSELDDSPFAAGVVFGGALAFRPDGAFLYSSGFGLNGFAVGADGSLERIGEQTFSDDVGSDFYASNLAIDAQGTFLVVSEFLLTRHVQVFSIDAASGGLVAASPPVTARSPYSVAIDASGRFVFASNDDETISGYRLRRSNGTLKELPGSPFPFGGLQPEMVLFQPQ